MHCISVAGDISEFTSETLPYIKRKQVGENYRVGARVQTPNRNKIITKLLRKQVKNYKYKVSRYSMVINSTLFTVLISLNFSNILLLQIHMLICQYVSDSIKTNCKIPHRAEEGQDIIPFYQTS